MALTQNKMGFSDQLPLEPGDVDDTVLDRLHSRALEDAVFSFATARHVVRQPVARMPTRFLDPSDDQDLFEEIMRR
jgi:hypothetical protein